MIIDKGCAERGCACYDDRVDKNGVEMVELLPEYTAFILDENGELVEMYMPNVPGDRIVPDKIVRILNICIEEKDETNKI